MTTEEKTKVLEALHIIKRECSMHICNDSCTLFTENGHCCSLQTDNGMPVAWDLPPLPAYNGELPFKEWNKFRELKKFSEALHEEINEERKTEERRKDGSC